MKKINILITIIFILSFATIITADTLTKSINANEINNEENQEEIDTKENVIEQVPIAEESKEDSLVKEEIITGNTTKQVQSINPTAGYILASNEIIVYTEDELRTTLAAVDGKTMIYLGADIKVIKATGFPINAAESNITIDGTNPNTLIRHTYDDYDSTTANAGIYIINRPSAANKITIKNMDVSIYNYYGMVTVYDNATVHTTIRYENVTYNGSQVAYNVGGRLELSNFNANIGFNNVPVGELAETSDVTFEGNVTINHTAPAGYFFIWARYGTNYTILVKNGANVKINTNTPLSRNNSSEAINNFIQEDNSSFEYNSTQTYSYSTFFIATLVDIGKGSTFTVNKINTPSAEVVNFPGSFNTKAGATINLTGNGTTYPFRFYTNSINGSIINITDNNVSRANESVRFYNSLNLIGSTINFNATGNTTSTVGYINVVGTANLSDSKISAKTTGNINSSILNFVTINMLRSTLDIIVDGSVSATADTNQTIKFTTISFTSSKIKARLNKNSGIILNFTSPLVLDSFSVIDLYSASNNKPMFKTTKTLEAKDGAKFLIESLTNNGTTSYLMQTADSIDFGKDTIVRLLAHNGNATTLIHNTSSSKYLSFNDVKNVILFGPKTTSLVSGNALDIYLYTQQINTWNTVTTYSNSGNLASPPSYYFRQIAYAPYEVIGLVSGNNSHIDYTSGTRFVDGDPYTDFNTKAKALSLGKMNVTLNESYEKTLSFTGTSDVGTINKITYKSNSVSKVAAAITTSDSKFNITTESLDAGSVDYVGNLNYLYYYETGNIIKLPGELIFEHVPTTTSFGINTIPYQTTFYNITTPNWYLGIKDDRDTTSNWKLSARLSKPLTSDDSFQETLPSALVFKDSEGNKSILSNSNSLIHQAINGTETTNLTWSNGTGILLEIQAGQVRKNTTYKTTIIFTLEDTP